MIEEQKGKAAFLRLHGEFECFKYIVASGGLCVNAVLGKTPPSLLYIHCDKNEK